MKHAYNMQFVISYSHGDYKILLAYAICSTSIYYLLNLNREYYVINWECSIFKPRGPPDDHCKEHLAVRLALPEVLYPLRQWSTIHSMPSWSISIMYSLTLVSYYAPPCRWEPISGVKLKHLWIGRLAWMVLMSPLGHGRWPTPPASAGGHISLATQLDLWQSSTLTQVWTAHLRR